MRSLFVKSALILTVVLSWSGVPAAERTDAANGTNPAFKTIGPLAFSPDGVLFAGDTQAASIFALDLGKAATGGAPGAKAIPAFDQKVAALLGTDVREITVTDLAVHPKTRNAFASVMRGQGTNAQPALLRIDGAGKIEVVAFGDVKFSKVDLPNAPAANPGDQRNARTSSITDMAFVDGRLYVAGLSNEEFSSKLRSVSYPFNTVDNGASVEIYHGNHGQFETRSPVYTFVPYKVKGETNLIAGYLCTPLVKFPVNSLQVGRQGDGHDHRRARQPQPPARHDRLSEGRQGVPADVEQQPRRDEDPDRRLRRCGEHHRARRRQGRRRLRDGGDA